MINAALFSSGTDEWETPQEFFNTLDKEFGFTLDVCALPSNTKVPHRYFTPGTDGLIQDWGGETAWCNPPYSKLNQDKFVQKCYEESKKPGTTVVALLPARTNTKRFHQYIYGKAEIRFLKGRLKFSGHKWNAPFPCMIVIWQQKNEK